MLFYMWENTLCTRRCGVWYDFHMSENGISIQSSGLCVGDKWSHNEVTHNSTDPILPHNQSAASHWYMLLEITVLLMKCHFIPNSTAEYKTDFIYHVYINCCFCQLHTLVNSYFQAAVSYPAHLENCTLVIVGLGMARGREEGAFNNTVDPTQSHAQPKHTEKKSKTE